MTRLGLFASLLAAAFAGAFVWGRYAVAKERWRRIKRDTKAQWKGLRTLWKMLRRAGRDVATSAALVLLAVALAIVVIVKGTP